MAKELQYVCNVLEIFEFPHLTDSITKEHHNYKV